LIYQVQDITNDYLKFYTDTNIEIKDISDFNQNIEVESFPSITTCTRYKNINQIINTIKAYGIETNYDNYTLSLIDREIKTNNSKIRKLLTNLLYLTQNNRQMYNFLKSNLDFDTIDQIQKNEIETYFLTETGLELIREQMNNMSDLYVLKLGNNRNIKKSKSISPEGECDTFSPENNQTSIQIDTTQSLFRINFKDFLSLKVYYFMDEKTYIHSSSLLPSLIYSENFNNNFGIKQIIEYRIKKLGYPYESNCYDYGNKTRAHCINQCYLNYYINQLNCVPQFDHLLTIKIGMDYIDPNVSFCSSNDRNKTKSMNHFLISHCNEMCRDSCEQQYFIIESTSDLNYDELNIEFGQKYYINVIDVPRMTFYQYIITIVNSMSLWYGINFRILMDFIIESTASLIEKHSFLLQIGYIIKNAFARIPFWQYLIELVYSQTIQNAFIIAKKYQKKSLKVFQTNISSYMTRNETFDISIIVDFFVDLINNSNLFKSFHL